MEKCDGMADISVKVRVLGLHEDIPITLAPGLPVRQLKGKLQSSKADLDALRQRIIFCGRELDDKDTLSASGLKDGSVVQVAMRPKR